MKPMARAGILASLVVLTLSGCASSPSGVSSPVPASAPAGAPSSGSPSGLAETAGPRPKMTAVRPPFMGDQPRETDDGSSCNMEVLNGTPWAPTVMAVPDKSMMDISGWGADTATKAAPTAIVVRLQDSANHQFFAPATLHERPDVATYFNAPTLAMSGYTAAFSAEDLPAGDYDADIVMDLGGRALTCSTHRKLRL